MFISISFSILSFTFLLNINNKKQSDFQKICKTTPFPITIENNTFKIGKTRVSEVLSSNLNLSKGENLENDFYDEYIDRNDFKYAYIHRNDEELGSILFFNNNNSKSSFKDCIICIYEVNFTNTADNIKKYNTKDILIGGINFSGMGINDVKNAMHEKTYIVTERTDQTGKLVQLVYYINNISIIISFDDYSRMVTNVKVQAFDKYFD